MNIKTNFSLKSYNTFGIEAKTRYFAEFTNIPELKQLLEVYPDKEILILGGGSNLLFTRDFAGVVLKNCITGVEKIQEDKDHAWLKVGAGEIWHHFVLYCIENNYAGVENLSLIPGTVGAAPMQNIGAYGVEIKEVVHRVEAISIQEKKIVNFSKEECRFGYRESIFKNTHKNQYVITAVYFKLNKHPDFNISYGAIESQLEKMQVKTLSVKAISEAVCAIRESKLPDPQKIGNGGSFFKNPEIPGTQLEELKKQFPAIVSYPLPGEQAKVPAGWLIEQAGWKGKRVGNVGVHKNQALVLVNYGEGKGEEIKELAEKIQTSVKEKFGIFLTPEINIF